MIDLIVLRYAYATLTLSLLKFQALNKLSNFLNNKTSKNPFSKNNLLKNKSEGHLNKIKDFQHKNQRMVTTNGSICYQNRLKEFLVLMFQISQDINVSNSSNMERNLKRWHCRMKKRIAWKIITNLANLFSVFIKEQLILIRLLIFNRIVKINIHHGTVLNSNNKRIKNKYIYLDNHNILPLSNLV